MEPTRISVSLALQSLQEQVETVDEAQAVLTRQRAVRDELIRDAHASRVPMRKLMRITGLSRERLYRIANGATLVEDKAGA